MRSTPPNFSLNFTHCRFILSAPLWKGVPGALKAMQLSNTSVASRSKAAKVGYAPGVLLFCRIVPRSIGSGMSFK